MENVFAIKRPLWKQCFPSMPGKTVPSLPPVARVLAELGANIKLARQRRALAAELVAERAGMSRPTLRSIERGDSSVTIGAIANVLHTLGLITDLGSVARDDSFGRRLEDAKLESRARVRAPSRKKRDG